MKKQLIQTVKALIAAVILSFGVSYAYAAWTGPTQAPPNGNTLAPINAGTTAQSKNGSLALGSSGAPAVTLDVTGNVGAGGAIFANDVDAGSFTLGGVTITTWPSGGVPSGAVEAFDLASCPAGWSEYISARDRTIIGSGLSYSRGATGGEAVHTLTINEIPPHTHNIGPLWAGGAGGGGATRIEAPWNTGDGGERLTTGYLTTNLTGGGQPHNNMQPYIALLFCKKN
jgi:hypothetical protein